MDKTSFKQITKDPSWQFWGVIFAILAIIISTIVAYNLAEKSKPLKKLSVEVIYKYGIVSKDRIGKTEIKMLYQDNEVTSISALLIKVKNTGNTEIRPNDYIKPFHLIIENSGEIADNPEIIDRFPANFDITVNKVTYNTIAISNSLINAGDEATIKITLINDPEPYNRTPSIVSQARIAGVSEIEIIGLEDENSPLLFLANARLTLNVWIFVLFGVGIALVLFLSLTSIKKANNSFFTQSFVEFKIVFIALMTGITFTYSFYLIGAIAFGFFQRSKWWQIWMPGIIGGGIIVMLYVIWFLSLVLKNSKIKSAHIEGTN